MLLTPSDGMRERRGSFCMLAQATAKFLHGTLTKADDLARSTPDLTNSNNINNNNNNNNNNNFNNNCLSYKRVVVSPKSNSSLTVENDQKGDSRRHSFSWIALCLDPGREHVLVAVQKQIRGRNRILASYRRVKNAMKELQDSYVASKETYNFLARYGAMKRMIKETYPSGQTRPPHCQDGVLFHVFSCVVIVLERQYWTLISIPKKELSDNQTEYVAKVLTHIEDRLKDDLPIQPAKGGLSGLFGNAANLAERAKEAKHLDELKNKSTDELRKESEKIQGDIFRLSKKYSALRQVVAQLNTNFQASKSYPIVPRYSMLKEMIKEALRAPAFVDVCHEQEECL